MTNIPQAMESPVPLREFLVSPGLAGVAAVVAALIVLFAVLYAGRRAGKRLDRELEQRELHHQEMRDEQAHAQESAQCWQTLKWLVETAGPEPAASEGATLGLGPELAMATLRGLLRDAERLGDDTLADAVTVYQNQFALVLAQQGGPLAELVASVKPPVDSERSPAPQPTPTREAAAKAAETAKAAESAKPAETTPDAPSASDETPTTTTELASGGRRHKR
jgi:hypothetical protein